MKLEAEITKLMDVAESRTKDYSIGRVVVFPIIQYAVGIGLFFVVLTLILQLFGMPNLLDNPDLRNTYITLYLILVSSLSLLEIFRGKIIMLKLVMKAYRLGLRNAGAKAVVADRKRKVVEVPAVPIVSNQTLQNEALVILLQDYYSSGKALSRERAMTLLDGKRNNVKESAETAIATLISSGVVTKGPKRNSPLVVVPDTFPKAKEMIKTYLKDGRK